MSDRLSRGRMRLAGLALVVVASLVVAAGALGGGARSAAPACDEVILNENSWVGSTANIYVLKNVLETKLKCKVKVLNITEGQPAFQAMADGKIDVVMEDWQNLPGTPYQKNKSVVSLGGNGITGVIGWYIPRYLLKQYPTVQDVAGAQGQGVRVQVARVGVAGDVPRR